MTNGRSPPEVCLATVLDSRCVEARLSAGDDGRDGLNGKTRRS